MNEHDTEQDHVESYEHGMLFANVKRSYDEYQELSLSAARRSQENKDQLNNVALQALQNAVTVANKVANDSADSSNAQNKQSIRHESIATDRQWNSLADQSNDLDQQNKEDTFQDKIRAEMISVLESFGITRKG